MLPLSWQNPARACLSSKTESCAELTTESRKGLTFLKGWTHFPEGTDITNTGQQNSGGMGSKLTPLYGMFKLQVENWAPELLTRCFWGWEAANLTWQKQIRSRGRRRYCWFINAPALELGGKSPEGLECRGLNSLPLRGRKQVWGKAPTLLPSVLLLGSTREAPAGCQAPQATSDVHVEPLARQCLSLLSCSQHSPGTGLAAFPTLHQTSHSYSSCSPKLGYFPWGLLSDCQFFQAEAMPALHFLFLPHTLTQALSVGSFLS